MIIGVVYLQFVTVTVTVLTSDHNANTDRRSSSTGII